TGTLPHRALASVCATAIGEGGAAAVLDQPAAIRSKHGVQMYGFRSTHLAQCRPGEEPVFLYRGARLIDQSEMTAAELRRMAEAMVLHIAATAKMPHGIGRGYSPVTNAFEDGAASSEATALALLALRRYMQPETTGVSPATIAEAK